MQTWGLFFLFLKIATVRTVVWRALGRKPVTMGKSLVAQLMLLVKNQAMRIWRAAPGRGQGGRSCGQPRREGGRDSRQEGRVAVCGRLRSKAGNAARNSSRNQQQYKRNKTVLAIPAWLVMDSRHRKKCLLWRVFPGKTPESAFTAGLLKEGASLDELAKEIDVDAKGLESTVSHFNEMVARGNDDDFGRGKSFYDQHFGDPTMKPIPILGTLEVGPSMRFKSGPVI
jgi:hypothetical protein